MSELNNQSDKLINQIKLYLNSGKDKFSIINYMVALGYNREYIEKLIEYAVSSQKPLNQNNQSFNLNTSANQIKRTSAATENNIPNSSLNNAKKNNLSVIILIVAFVFFAIIGLLFLLRGDKQSDEFISIDYNIALTENTYYAGEFIEINAVSFTRGANEPLTILADFEIMDSNNNLVAGWEEDYTILTSLREIVRKEIPNHLQPGEYYLHSILRYGDGQEVESRIIAFNVISRSELDDNKPEAKQDFDYLNNDEDKEVDGDKENDVVFDDPDEENMQEDDLKYNDSEEDDFEETVPLIGDDDENQENNEEIIVDDNDDEDYEQDLADSDDEYSALNQNDLIEQQRNHQQNIADVFEKAKSAAQSDPEQAGELCFSLTERRTTDNCLQQSAKVSKNYRFCEEILDHSIRDFCFLTYVIDTKDYDKCKQIVNDNTKNSCIRLDQSQGEI